MELTPAGFRILLYLPFIPQVRGRKPLEKQMKRFAPFLLAIVLLMSWGEVTAQHPQLPVLAEPLEAPKYPPEARKYGIEGTTVVGFQVVGSGTVSRIVVSRSSGFDLLDAEAMRIAKTARFLPYKQGDGQRPIWVNMPVRFVLEGTRPAALITNIVEISTSSSQAAAPMIVTVTKDGQPYLGSTPTGFGDLRERLKEASQVNRVSLHIRADEETPYGQVARVIAAAQTAGVADIRFVVAAQVP